MARMARTIWAIAMRHMGVPVYSCPFCKECQIKVDRATAYGQLAQAIRIVGPLSEADNLPRRAKDALINALAGLVMAQLELACPCCGQLVDSPGGIKDNARPPGRRY
jgi:hypothetical protein